MTKKNYPISSSLRIEVQQVAINHLGLRDIFQLRDRFEGQAYMDNLLLKVAALNVLEKCTGLDFIEWAATKWDKKGDYTKITIGGKPYRVIPFFFGSLPLVHSEIDIPIIFVAVRAGFSHGIVCGVLINLDFENQSLFVSKVSGTKTKLKKFIGFKFLTELPAQ